jgi:hypothetical protein
MHEAAMTEAEATRFTKRMAIFRRRGWPEDRAFAMAERLWMRDGTEDQRAAKLSDDRRVCIECKHLQMKGGCFAASQGQGADAEFPPISTPVPDMLHRCSTFEWARA